jgi:hypothetical protein
MFDHSMTGAVGCALQAERLAQATRNVRLIEAEQASAAKRTGRRVVSREGIAEGLVALAARIAPTTVTTARTGIGVVAR